MDDLKDRAALSGIETEYSDGLGQRRIVEPETLSRLIDILGASGASMQDLGAAPDVLSRRAYQGSDALPKRAWALAVQLYGVRSRRNWGHGDFTDLRKLLDLAAGLGAAGVGLNPLHAIFDDRADEFSPYSPSSRLFLNTHYIDPDDVPEFSNARAGWLSDILTALRSAYLVDYAGVIRAKSRAVDVAYKAFRATGSADRKQAFLDFRERGGALLLRFSTFELLRRRFAAPWWTWPEEWRTPDDERLTVLRSKEDEAAGYYEYLQWIADTQLRKCCERAADLNLPIGLYLDIAVGVRPDGFDAWNEQAIVDRAFEIGAPPDPLNVEGQRWGLAGVNPSALESAGCEPFRRMLQASMQYAGAVRLDHVMGLRRLYLIPDGMRGDQGAYVRFPFERMLATAVEESNVHLCIVIGEDLGTVPENFRERLAQAGIWSYQVMLFQRAADGGFIAPDLYRENALVTFSTHDLPTFEGWKTSQDLSVKRKLGLDPGETADQRKNALEAIGRTMTWHGFPTVDYAGVVGFLAHTPSRLLMVSAEDALGLVDQVNVPGTIAEHPNWRRRLSANLEDLGKTPLLTIISKVLALAGRSVSSR